MVLTGHQIGRLIVVILGLALVAVTRRWPYRYKAALKARLRELYEDVRAFVLGEQDSREYAALRARVRSEFGPWPHSTRTVPEFSIDISGTWSGRQADAVCKALAPEAAANGVRFVLSRATCASDPSDRVFIGCEPEEYGCAPSPRPGEIRILARGQSC